MENQELIVVKQLPVIEEQLKELSTEIDKKVEEAKSLVCTEENKQIVKDKRAELKKVFNDLEEKRKNVKNAVMNPYNEFEKVYKQYVTEKFTGADKELKSKIDAIEDEQKKRLEDGAREYFDEYKESKNIDFIKFENMGIKVGLSDNPTKLKKQVVAFIDKVEEELKLIETQEHKAEILVEYKQTLNVSNAITTVTNRFKVIEEEKKRQEEIARRQVDEKIKEESEKFKQDFENFKVHDEEAFKVVEEEKEIIFKVKVTDRQIEKIEQYFKLNNIDFEREDI